MDKWHSLDSINTPNSLNAHQIKFQDKKVINHPDLNDKKLAILGNLKLIYTQNPLHKLEEMSELESRILKEREDAQTKK